MANIFYAIAILLVIAWALGLFMFNAGEMIHTLLLLALLSVVLRLFLGKTIVK